MNEVTQSPYKRYPREHCVSLSALGRGKEKMAACKPGTETWPDSDFHGYSILDLPFSRNVRTRWLLLKPHGLQHSVTTARNGQDTCKGYNKKVHMTVVHKGGAMRPTRVVYTFLTESRVTAWTGGIFISLTWGLIVFQSTNVQTQMKMWPNHGSRKHKVISELISKGNRYKDL